MIDYSAYIKENSAGVLASQNGQKVSTRVLQALFAEGGNIYFCTGASKQLYEELLRNPNVSFCTHGVNFSLALSVSGKAVLTEDSAVKERAFNSSPMIRNSYKTLDNPDFKVFYIDVENIKTYGFSEGAKFYKR